MGSPALRFGVFQLAALLVVHAGGVAALLVEEELKGRFLESLLLAGFLALAGLAPASLLARAQAPLFAGRAPAYRFWVMAAAASVVIGAAVVSLELGLGAPVFLFGMAGAFPVGQGVALIRRGRQAALIPLFALVSGGLGWLIVTRIDLNDAGLGLLLPLIAFVDGLSAAGAALGAARVLRSP